MLSQKTSQKVENLHNEFLIFREKCEATLATSMKLGNRNQYLCDELMVLMEESAVEKSKTLKVLELARSESNSERACFAELLNIREETAIIHAMLEEVQKNVFFSDSTNVRSLHTHLLSLPFLPQPRRSRLLESCT